MGVDGERVAMVIFGIATSFLGVAPAAEKSAYEATNALSSCVSRRETVNSFYSDNASELFKAAKLLGWQHPTSTPYVSHTNGVVERQIRTVEEGTRTLLTQAGLPAKLWSYASHAFCHSRNVAMRDGTSAWRKRF